MRIKMMAILTVIILLLTVSASAETTVIRMTCGGDALLGCNEKVREGGYEYSYDRYIDENGYSYPFANLMELFANDDITLLNLEVVLADEPEEKAGVRVCKGFLYEKGHYGEQYPMDAHVVYFFLGSFFI